MATFRGSVMAPKRRAQASYGSFPFSGGATEPE